MEFIGGKYVDNGLIYTDPSDPAQSFSFNVVGFGTYSYSDPSTPTQEFTIQAIAFTLNQPVESATYYNRTILIDATVGTAAKMKCDFNDVPYADMAYQVNSVASLQPSGTITFTDALTDGNYTLYVKLVDADDNPLAYGGVVHITAERSPIGPDSPQLLRLRKFFKQGSMNRWQGNEVKLP